MEPLPQFTAQDFSSKQIAHLGLVAGMIDESGISAVIDDVLPKTRNHILPHSAVVKAMLLNGLGFNERRLYFFSRFFTNLSTEKLFGPGVCGLEKAVWADSVNGVVLCEHCYRREIRGKTILG